MSTYALFCFKKKKVVMNTQRYHLRSQQMLVTIVLGYILVLTLIPMTL